MAHTFEEMKEHNRRIGHHWFDADTMAFFKTKIVAGPFRNDTFVTQETNPSRETRYTVRQYDRNVGNIRTVGEFHSYETEDDAIDAAKATPPIPDADDDR